MSENTKIEWADHTFNPWIGCTKVGPGCDNCYAKADFEDRKHRVVWGAGHPRSRTSIANWKQPVKWNRHAGVMQNAWDIGVQMHDGDEAACIAAGFIKPQRPKVFCASLADVFDNEVDPQWRVDLFELIAKTPHLDWLLLTKRIGNARDMLNATVETMAHGINDWDYLPWPNVWIGVTIVNQEESDRDIPKLLAVPAAKRFLSMEPLLGPVELPRFCACGCMKPVKQAIREATNGPSAMNADQADAAIKKTLGLDWVIVGGESGPDARPMHPDWARSLRNQCVAAGVPFLFKQWGEWAPHQAVAGGNEGGDLRRGHVRYMQGDGREPDGHFRKGDAAVARIGKKAAGRLLEGHEWNRAPV
jgi:protein gp37